MCPRHRGIRRSALFTHRRRPTRQTLADVARRGRRPATTVGYNQLEAEFNAAEREADRAAQAAGTGEAGLKAYLSKAPKWADFGPRFWSLAESDPRSPAAFDALLWIIGHYFRFFDAGADRDATASKAIDVLLRDHAEEISSNLASRNVATASTMAAPCRGRISAASIAPFRAAATANAWSDGAGPGPASQGRGGTRGEHRHAGSRPRNAARPGHVAVVVHRAAQRADSAAMRREAETILERVKAEYGDVRHLLGEVVQPETWPPSPIESSRPQDARHR